MHFIRGLVVLRGLTLGDYYTEIANWLLYIGTFVYFSGDVNIYIRRPWKKQMGYKPILKLNIWITQRELRTSLRVRTTTTCCRCESACGSLLSMMIITMAS